MRGEPALARQPLAHSPQPLAPVPAAFIAGVARVVRAARRSSAAARAPTGTRCPIRAPRISATSRCSGRRHDAARHRRRALYYAFIAPWATWPIATAVLVCAALGIVAAVPARTPRALMTARGRVRAVSGLRPAVPGDLHQPLRAAAGGADGVSRGRGAAPAAPTSGCVAAARSRCSTRTSAARQSPRMREQKAPAFRLLDEMRDARAAATGAARAGDGPPQELRFSAAARVGGRRMPPMARTLPAPPQHEWLEAVKYWNGGGRAPVWFLVDPRRTSIDLVQHGEPSRTAGRCRIRCCVSGVRPNEMDWYRGRPPGVVRRRRMGADAGSRGRGGDGPRGLRRRRSRAGPAATARRR